MQIILGIILSLLLLIFLLLLLKVKLNIVLEDSLGVYLKILFIKIRLYPSKSDKKKKPKRPKKEKPKSKKKEAPPEEKPKEKAPKPTIFDYVKIILDVVKVFFKRFGKHFHIKIAKIHVRVATGDAASTAILYGSISQALSYLIATLDSITNLDGMKKADICVYPDYLSNKFEAKINLTFSIRLIGVVDTALRSLFRFLKLYKRAKAVSKAKAAAKLAKSESSAPLVKK